MEALRNFIGQIGVRRAALMGGVSLALLAGLAWMAMHTPQSAMGYLYTDLDPSAAATITDKLKGQGVPFQLSADGTAIMAPVDKLPELRMAMASEQLGGKIGYEVLDEEEPFGISSSRAKLNETRALEGELTRSIESLDRVSKARVHVVMPDRAMFETEPRKATASVTVKTNGRLPGEAVQAIRYLVSSAVPDLAPEAVSVVDQTGALLARAGEGGDGATSDLEDRQAAVEARLRDQIETLVEPIVGHGKVRAEVSAELERDQVREQSETFDPDKQVIQHQVSVESGSQSNENAPGAQGATVAAQLPENTAAPAAGGAAGDSRNAAQNETSEDVTYQNSRLEKVAVRAPGQVKRLTVAVMIDGGEKGLPQPQIERLQRVVENAVGFNGDRGDSVVVENMPFAAEDVDGINGGLPFGLTVDRILDVLKILLVGGIVLFAIRMLRRQGGPALLPSPDHGGDGEDRRQPRGDVSMAHLEPMDQGGGMGVPLLDQEVSLAHVDGRVKLSAIKRIGETIATNPADSASVIRQWMNT
ncbi:flagellar basal-body MS-ring/collar protein FliF [Novosphingobium colocasiae]|uniref:Flagellar M-ring protein n=1 Tax=Novosphingobium colocasiae TaxID=1256513 RepID=A0A918UF79_9SPHN|nr:flagellar M-ring protein [Novosphingobium colocasiae]